MRKIGKEFQAGPTDLVVPVPVHLLLILPVLQVQALVQLRARRGKAMSAASQVRSLYLRSLYPQALVQLRAGAGDERSTRARVARVARPAAPPLLSNAPSAPCFRGAG